MANFWQPGRKEWGLNRVLAVGGDGTSFEVANGLWWEPAGRVPSLGIVPFGSGCDYIRNFEVGPTILENLHKALGPTVVNVDLAVARLRDPQGKIISRIFLNALGIGFDAQVATRLQRQEVLKKHGRIAFILSTLQELGRLRHFHWRAKIDGEDLQERSIIFVAGLGRYFGGGMMIAPSASPQAGGLQMIWDRGLNRLELAMLLPRFYGGRHLTHPKAQTGFARSIRLEAEPAAPVEADGELVGLSPVELEVYSKAFWVAAKGLKGLKEKQGPAETFTDALADLPSSGRLELHN